MKKKITAVIVAAGSSSRMKIDKSKLFLEICGKTVIKRTLEKFQNCDLIDKIVLVTREQDKAEMQIQAKQISKLVAIVGGGKDRQESVYNGVTFDKDCDFVLIHDGARPLVNISDIEKVCECAIKHGGASLAVKAKDTIKQTDDNDFVINTPNRETLWQVQTPQVFDYKLYMKAFQKAIDKNESFTDDCQLFENNMLKVFMCQGDYRNIKITSPEDVAVAKAFLEEGKTCMQRIGHGYDVHKLVVSRKLILGGVHIEHETGLLGHSDADVLCHAISDALLGAVGLGDIGKMFPDNDEKYKGADSIKLLEQVVKAVQEKGYAVSNIDATVIAQAPKLAPFIEKMRFNIAKACSCESDFVNVKATTEEGLGFSGAKEGISAHAVAMVIRV